VYIIDRDEEDVRERERERREIVKIYSRKTN